MLTKKEKRSILFKYYSEETPRQWVVQKGKLSRLDIFVPATEENIRILQHCVNYKLKVHKNSVRVKSRYFRIFETWKSSEQTLNKKVSLFITDISAVLKEIVQARE